MAGSGSTAKPKCSSGLTWSLPAKAGSTPEPICSFLPSEMDKLIPLGVWGIGNDHMKIGGVKYFTDGSIQGFTGALLEDYYTRPG